MPNYVFCTVKEGLVDEGGWVDIRLGGAGSSGAWGVGRANLNRRKRDEADEKAILPCTHSTNLFLTTSFSS